jgi:uncharacterized protein (DUF433 family)/transposase
MVEMTVLSRPVMSAREAARQLNIPSSTVVQWLEGYRRHGTWYAPVLREEPTGEQTMTWGEVVEARYLRAYRQENVSLQQLRPFIREMRQVFGIPYPLAHFKPFVDEGRRLLVELQERVSLPDAFRVVYEAKTGQLVLTPAADDFLRRVEFSDHGLREAVQMRPAGPESPVVMNPSLSSAATTVRGVRTEVLAELHDAGEPISGIAEDFDLPEEVVKAAIAWEWAKTA